MAAFEGKKGKGGPESEKGPDRWRAVRPFIAASFAAILIVSVSFASRAGELGLVKIAVFDFVLDDRSAGGGIIGPDQIDAENLKKSSEDARELLSSSKLYSVVDASGAAADVASAGGIEHCNGCEAQLAQKLGADQSMAGIFTRVNRTEYTLQIVVRDAKTGALVSNAFTGLRMGANYAWPRGVKWLIENKILPAHHVD